MIRTGHRLFRASFKMCIPSTTCLSQKIWLHFSTRPKGPKGLSKQAQPVCFGSGILNLVSVPVRVKSVREMSVKKPEQEIGKSIREQQHQEGSEFKDFSAVFKGTEPDFSGINEMHEASSKPYTPNFESEAKNYKIYRHEAPFHFQLNGRVLPHLDIAYETWGELNDSKSNAILVIGGVSSSSHVTESEANPAPGWWNNFVGPNNVLDTENFHVIGINILGSCYGTSGPRSINPSTGKPYGTTFPIITVRDMANAVFLLLDHLGIDKVHAYVGSSLGGMILLQCAVDRPHRNHKLASLSSCCQAESYAIGLRHGQCQAIMNDPHWKGGFYYGQSFPWAGLALSRSIGMATYRSSEEWAQRFALDRIPNNSPSLNPMFQVESYLKYQGQKFCYRFDPNSVLYLSKATDMFDISEGYQSLEESLAKVAGPVLVIGTISDVLFPLRQQRLLANKLVKAGNKQVTFQPFEGHFGHDSFLLDKSGFGVALKGFLETELADYGLSNV